MEATLSLWAVKNGAFSSGAKSVDKLSKSFDQSSVTWNSPWKNAGGDYAGSAASSTSGSVNKWETFNVKSAIENIIEEGGANNGFLIRMTSATSGVTYYSSENSDSEHRPKLTIKYHTYETNPPTVKILVPNGGEEYVRQELKTITWEASDDDGIASQQLFITPNDGASWIEFADIGKDTRSYEFEVPFFITQQYRAKVTAVDLSGNSASDLSDDFFRVNPDTTNPSSNYVNFAEWDPMSDPTSSYDYGAGASDSISMKYTKAPKQTMDDPWVSLGSYLPSGKTMDGVEWIKIKYRCDFNILMSLYNEALANEGEGFNVTLIPTSSDDWETAFYYVDDRVFKQPDWVTSKIDLDLKTMEGLSFEPDMGYGGGEAHLQVGEIILYGFDNTNAVVGQASKNSWGIPQIGNSVNGNISLNLTNAGSYKIAVFGLSGKKVSEKSITFSSAGKQIVTGVTANLAKGTYLVHLSNGGAKYIKSITIK